MPLTIAPGRVKASPMETGKAMANTAEIAAAPRIRPGPAGGLAAALVLVHSEVMQETLGGRTWVGVLANVADAACVEAAVRIHFLDRVGRPVGAPVSARAARLAPAGALHLRSRLPAAAAGLRIDALRWTTSGRTVERGPFRPVGFAAAPD